MHNLEPLKLIEASMLFRNLQPDETAAIIAHLRSASFVRGSRIMERGVWHGLLYIIASGQVSVLLHPFPVGSAPLLWRDWSRRQHRRACMHLLRQQQVVVQIDQVPSACSPPTLLSRAQRAHSRLDWPQRLARNARIPTASRVTIRLFGVPESFAILLGLAIA